MKLFSLMTALMVAAASQTAAATLVVTLKSQNTVTVGTSYLESPSVTLRFADAADYTGVAPASIPLFGLAQFVDATWTRLENMAYISAVDNFLNPPLTQDIVDAAQVTMGPYYTTGGIQENIGIFAGVTGAIAVGSRIEWRPAAGLATIRLHSDSPGRFGVRGNWDDDAFSDSFPWDFTLAGVQWDAAATGFADPGSTPAVPLPAGLPLLVGGLAALGLIRRRKSEAA